MIDFRPPLIGTRLTSARCRCSMQLPDQGLPPWGSAAPANGHGQLSDNRWQRYCCRCWTSAETADGQLSRGRQDEDGVARLAQRDTVSRLLFAYVDRIPMKFGEAV